MFARKEAYKAAWNKLAHNLDELKTQFLNTTRSVGNLQSESTQLKLNLTATENDVRWYARWFAAFLVATLMALACLVAAIIQSLVKAWYQVNVSPDVPWTVQFFQGIALGVSALVIPGAVYWRQRVRSDYTTGWGTVFQIGFVGTLLGGLLFFLQMSPEIVSVLLTAFGKIAVTKEFEPQFYVFLILERIVLMPLCGFFGAAFWHLVLPRPDQLKDKRQPTAGTRWAGNAGAALGEEADAALD